MGFLTPQFLGLFVHAVSKFQDAAGYILCHHNRGPVVRLHHHFPHQFAGQQAFPTLHFQVRIFRCGCSLCNLKLRIQTFGFQAQDASHHLGQAGRGTPHICIFFKNHATGPGVDQYGRLRQHRRRGPYLRAVDEKKHRRKE